MTSARIDKRPVDDHFRLSAPAGTIRTEGTTTQVGPDRSCNSMWSGPRPTKGTTGLMPIVDATNDTPPPPNCPLCNQGAERTTIQYADTIVTQSSICSTGHLYQLRWLVADVA